MTTTMRIIGSESGRSSTPGRSRLGWEDGSLLIEVMVTTLVLTIVSLSIFSALDGASAVSSTERARAMASGVAQEDQERMRSFRAVDLSNYRNTYTRTVAGVPYTVTSRADWVTDQSGTASCTSSDANADYLKITSSVLWPKRKATNPIVMTSLIAPPNGSFGTDQGTLAVQVRDPAGNPVQGTTVNLTGPQGMSDVTNSLGCVLWGFLPAGNYTVTLASGCVDRQGVSPPSQLVSVIGDATNTVALDCGFPGGVNAVFDTKRLGAASAQASNARYLSVANSGLAAPGTRVFGNGSLAGSIAATSLFPFTDPYNVYSGNCVNASPTQYGQPLGPPPSGVTVVSGSNPTVTIRQPSVNVKVTDSTGSTPRVGARVRATATAVGCGGIVDMGPTNSNGEAPDPGLPYGIYTVCAEWAGQKKTVTNVNNNNPNGTAQVLLNVPSSGSSGTCP